MVSTAVVVERPEEGHALPVQRPVYFISEVLSETKVRYPQIQKLIYAMILARRKLQHYFLSHRITVVSSFPLGEIIQSREATGRIAKWSVELMSETLTYAPRKAISLKLWWISLRSGQTPSSPSSSSSGAVDDVLRRISHEDRSWGRPAIHLTPWRPHEVCH